MVTAVVKSDEKRDRIRLLADLQGVIENVELAATIKNLKNGQMIFELFCSSVNGKIDEILANDKEHIDCLVSIHAVQEEVKEEIGNLKALVQEIQASHLMTLLHGISERLTPVAQTGPVAQDVQQPMPRPQGPLNGPPRNPPGRGGLGGFV